MKPTKQPKEQKPQEELWENEIFKIVSRIIGTAIQKDTISGKYAKDFEKYRNEISEIISQEKQKSFKLGKKEAREEILGKLPEIEDTLDNTYVGGDKLLVESDMYGFKIALKIAKDIIKKLEDKN